MKGRKAELKAIDGGLKGVPKPPAEIPACMVEEWETIASDMVARKILTASMSGVLSTYVIALWTVREAQRVIQEHGLLVKTAHGMPKPNPACGVLAKSQEAVARRTRAHSGRPSQTGFPAERRQQ